ncbi:PfkB family carbohydrate kinase [Brevibacillus dissolubilis]|uniref:PfkB family carbohydrate kinase n=1 Tax=Brevibacillus dissolubilis TaxID=1844116 RepID=UPI0011166D83|nr:PfkB family carbohydrate kinase [Brevibacillus dissolubilis]
MNSFVTVIGTVFMDVKGFANQNYQATGRNLGNIQFVHGGVGRNVAENLAKLGTNTGFVSTVDSSGMGLEVINHLQANSIETSFVQATDNGMGMWLAILNENGELAGSISQMPQVNTMQELIIKHAEEFISKSSHVVLEIDLTVEIARHVIAVAKKHNKPVYGIPGNLDVAGKYKDVLDGLDCFIFNNYEADVLFGHEFTSLELEAKLDAVKTYVDQSVGLQSVVVTLGEQGSVYYDRRTQELGHQPVFPVDLIDSSGAGDSFFSGTVMALIRGVALKNAVICGTKVAGWTITVKESICPDLTEKAQADAEFQRILTKAEVTLP